MAITTIIRFENFGIIELKDLLIRMGYPLANPGSGEIFGWRDEGRVILERSQVDTFLRSGHLLQLWISSCEDITISFTDGLAEIHFDGVEIEQQRRIQKGLERLDIEYLVGTEEEFYGG